MKYLITFSLFIFLGLANANAQKTPKIKTIEFEVNGVCKMCEQRIETAALIKGVKLAEWDKFEQKIKVIYSPKKVDEQSIHNAISEVGHDTELVKATDEAYAELPDCCRYRHGETDVH